MYRFPRRASRAPDTTFRRVLLLLAGAAFAFLPAWVVSTMLTPTRGAVEAVTGVEAAGPVWPHEASLALTWALFAVAFVVARIVRWRGLRPSA